MISSEEFNSHVLTEDLDAWKLDGTPGWDILLGAILLLSTVIAAPGNILALKYFLSKKERVLPNKLYISICCIDLCTSICHIPVAMSLVSGRNPVLFNNFMFCTAWPFVFMFLHKISMFLVMLMSVSRCASIVLPFQKVRETMFLAFPFYSLLIVLHMVMYFMDTSVVYGPDTSYCFFMSEETRESEIWKNIDIVLGALQMVEVGVPPVICFVSFVLCAINLSSSAPTEGSHHRNKRAAVTVTIFTGLFMVCNLPYFINVTLETVTTSLFEWPGPFFSPMFMKWYSWPVSMILLSVLNATLNPLLYYCRMTGFKDWIAECKFLFNTEISV